MNLIVSTIGSSIFFNVTKNNEEKYGERKLLNRYTNLKEKELAGEIKNRIDGMVKRAKKKLESHNLKEICSFSAELNGILSFYDHKISNHSRDVHLLLSTDTYIGKKTSQLVKSFLEKKDLVVTTASIRNLSTKDSDSFNEGLKKLIDYLYIKIPKYKNRNYQIVFNLTGGFKAVQAYMNTIGMFLADKLIYKFLTGKLIKMPSLPIKLDNFHLMEEYSKYFGMLDNRRYLLTKHLPKEFWRDISTLYYEKIEIEGKTYIELSHWGTLMWKEHKDKIYENRLIQFPNLVYTDKFKVSFKGSQQTSRIRLNNTLAKVANILLEDEGNEKLQRNGIKYSNYKSTKLHGHNIGHFRISKSLRVNCLQLKDKIYLLEFGKHDIENNLDKYDEIIKKIAKNN